MIYRHISYGRSSNYETTENTIIYPTENLICYRDATECLQVDNHAIKTFIELKYAEQKIRTDYFGFYAIMFFLPFIIFVLFLRELKK